MLSPSNNIVFIIAIVTVMFFMMGVFMVLYVTIYNSRKKKHIEEKAIMEQTFEQELIKTQVEVQESTFAALGKELHDNVGQLLSTTKMLIGITERSLAHPPDTLFTANQTLGKAISELRSLSKTLNKEWLEQFSLLENLEAEVLRINATKTIQLHLYHPAQIFLKPDEQIILFRIIQEAIQNAVKHSGARNIKINISSQPEHLVTTVTDDGACFDIATITNGLGIMNMRQRAKLLGGNVQWINNNGGCVVHIIIPVKTKDK